jgi:hypothetical protein
MCELEAAVAKGGGDAIAYPGDTIGVRSIVLRAKVSGGVAGESHQVRLVKNGVPFGDAVDVTGDPFVFETIVPAPAAGEDRWRAEVLLEGAPLTVTSHVWLKLDANGPVAQDDAGGGGGGCAIVPREESSRSPLMPLALAGAAALGALAVRVRARRDRRDRRAR